MNARPVNAADVAYCGGVLTRAGEELLSIFKKEERFVHLEDAIRRFQEANGMAAERIRTALFEKYPDIHWSDSEFKLANQERPEFAGSYWICDAIDGAVHFLQGFTFWAISLCLVQNGQPVLALVYDPCQQELFHAIAGEGAFLNGKPIQVAQKETLATAILATSPPAMPAKDPDTTKQTSDSIARMLPLAFAVRMLGSVSLQLAYVACGRLDGYWEFGSDYYDWLPASLLVREAGGLVTDSAGGAFTWATTGIVAGNPMLTERLQKAIRE